ncbi:MAG: hypothetical protein IH852_01205 [Bacteroidetes bacterium]|nr:hypothetical protein [Bacteroidota bacterium]
MEESTYRIFNIILKFIGVCGLVIASLFALWKYTDNAEKQFKKPYWENKLKIYLEVADVISSIAELNEGPEREKTIQKYWTLYFGKLAVVEDPVVEMLMIGFSNCLDGTSECNKCELRKRALQTSHAMREALGKSWDMDLEELEGYYHKN